MKLPHTFIPKTERSVINSFGGFDRRDGVSGITFSYMENMSGDCSPLVSSRRKRGIVNTGDSGVQNILSADMRTPGSEIIKGALLTECGNRIKAFYTDEGGFCAHDLVNLSSSEEARSYVTCGSDIYIFPDKIKLSLMDCTRTSPLETVSLMKLGAQEGYFYEMVFSPCDIDGNDVTGDSQFTSVVRNYYREVNSQKGEHLGKMAFNAGFSDGDVIKLSGFSDGELNGYFEIVRADSVNRRIVLRAALSAVVSSGNVTFERTVPEMDFVVSAGNRLWGCRYGIDENGGSLNEIYASALGDAGNWHRFRGISTDSWTASVGAPGAFTGAVCYNGHPIFFKEDCIIKVFGDKPSEFTLSESRVRGVEAGSAGSIANVNDTLFYKSYSGIVKYDGGIPRNVDAALGNTRCKNAVAGSDGSKYYVSMESEDGECHLFVYDSDKKLWHRQDSSRALSFCRCGSELFMLTGDGLYGINGTYNSDNAQSGSSEDSIRWCCITNPIGYGASEHKYISSLSLRLETEKCSEFGIYMEYDGDGIWHRAAEIKNPADTTVFVPLFPRRCDSFRLKLSGVGSMKLRSAAFTMEEMA